MRIPFLLFLFFGFGELFSQTITGTVREKGSGLPLPIANVFVSNTTLGKATDKDGKFRISGDFPQEIEVVASFVGYITEVKKVSTRGKSEIQLNFELALNESNLTEIELKARRDKNWEREFRRFEEVFLALPDDPYKPKIEITNPWVVNFEKVKAQGTPNYLQATAQEPIKIINRALGYEIDYYLQDYRVARGGSRFYGQVFYEPIDEKAQVEEWTTARDENFYNSVRYLNQTILLSAPDTVHFRIYHALPKQMDRIRTNDFYEEIGESILLVPKDSIVRRPLGNGNFRIFLPGRMEIHHLDKPWKNDYYTNIYHAISWIMAPQGYYDVDRHGLLINPTQLVLSGYLGRQRMARILPLDFVPINQWIANTEEKVVVVNPVAKWDRFREKAWLTTNKAYFYPGETVWIGGQMVYKESTNSDSLSSVLYVDLVGQDSVYQSLTFQLEEGRISGGFEIPQTLPAGDYALRAYTNWSRNFSDSDQFLLALPVLDPQLKPQAENRIEEDLFGGISVQPSFSVFDSLSYRVLDLEFNFLDEFQNPIDASLVLSITDGEEVAFLQQQNDLEKALDWLDQGLPENFVTDLSHQIEYGISVQGKFIPDNRRRSLVQPITIVRGDLEDYGQVRSDSLGRFWATGMVYRDTAQIAIAAVDERRKPFGLIEFSPLTKPTLPASIPKLDFKTEPMTEEAIVLDISGDYILLEEFVKEEVKEPETMANRNYGYGEPTQQVGPAQLEKETMAEILGRFGFNLNTLKFRNYTYGDSTGSPLLIVDGSSMPFLEKADFREILLGFEPSQLQSIKVYSDNISKSIFGMAGYAGVIMIETKNGFRSSPKSERKFNPVGFKIFSVPGFTSFTEFPNQPPSDQFLKRRPTLYWNPFAETQDGAFKTQVKVPYGVKVIRVKLDGRTTDGELIDRVLELRL